MPKSSVSDIPKVPGPATLLCHKRKFYPTKMQKSIKHTKWKVSKQKITNSVGHFSFFSLFSLGWGVISIYLGYKGGGGLLPKISYEEGGHHILQELPFKSPRPPPPLKINGPYILVLIPLTPPLRHVQTDANNNSVCHNLVLDFKKKSGAFENLELSATQLRNS